MMLRSNFLSRIKKVCNAAIASRILRGAEQRITPVSCVAVTKSTKSSKTTSDGPREPTQKDSKDAIVQVVKKPSQKKNTQIINAKETTIETIEPVYNIHRAVTESQYEKCQRIIDQAFGTGEIKEPGYFSHGVDIEQTRQELEKTEHVTLTENVITDDKTQVLLLQPSPALECVRVEPEILNTDTDEDMILIKPTLNILLMSARPPDDLIKGTEDNKDLPNQNLHLEETITTEEVDKYLRHENLDKTLYETHEESQQNTAHTIDLSETKKKQDEPPVINKCTKHIPDIERKTDVDVVLQDSYEPSIADTEYIVNRDKQFNEVMDSCLHPKLRHNAVVNTTTAKEEKERLKQKVEHIEETPLVEAQKQPIEGFNVTPRVLGELEQVYNWIANKHVDPTRPDPTGQKSSCADSGDLDEAVKYCLDSPVGQIDEALLNELEKLGIAITAPNQPRSPGIDDNRVQMNVLLSRKCDNKIDVDDSFEIYSGSMYPIQSKITEKLLPDKDAEAEELARKLAAEEEEEYLAMYPSRTHIDKNYDLPFERSLKMGIQKAQAAQAKPELVNPEQFNPARIAPIIEEISTNVIMQVPPERPTLCDNKIDVDDSFEIYSGSMYPIQSKITEKLLPDKDAEAEELARKLAAEEEEEYLAMYPSRTHIDKNYDLPFERSLKMGIQKAQAAQAKPELVNPEQFNPARIAPIIEEISTNVIMQVPPERPTLFQDTKLNINQTDINKVNPTNSIERTDINEKLIAEQFFVRPTAQEAKQASTESKPKETLVTKPWNPLAKPGYRYVAQTDNSSLRKKHLQKSYAKGMEKPVYYQSTTADSMWNSQPKPKETCNRKSIHKPAEKHHTYLLMDLTNKRDQYSSGKSKYTGTAERINEHCIRNISAVNKDQGHRAPQSKIRTRNARLNTADEIQKDVKTAGPTKDKLVTPLGMSEEGPVSKSAENYMSPPPLQQTNKINSNVSDGIWDENIDGLTPKEKTVFPEDLMTQQLDPHYVLKCNETCPNSPKPAPSRLMESTRAILYEEQIDLTKLPKLNEDLPLSELLKRVRERNRIIECRNELKALGIKLDPILAQVGKCPRKAPRCAPTAPRSPPPNPVPPPLFGLPTPPRSPPSCKPRKPRTRKCSTCDMDLSPSLRLGPGFNVPIAEVQAEMLCEMKDIGPDVFAARLKADLTAEVIEKLQILGKLLGRLLRQGRAHMHDAEAVSKTRPGLRTMLAKDYAPWTPIPSWPIPKKPPRRKPPCQKGCPSCPPPLGKLNPEPPCNLKPCEGFPKKSFSLIDCFAVTIGKNKVYEIGKF
ncbi:uncharacterized protein LOC118278503 [Spodoptera frugiperda]|uniref:Uncharacterized protein LOC118278503 n=1 Tax=Spodoptera frugiperda TaxID=7108 RepID=A0A9R0ERQ7_SPOFR|nr:uncharacterized protein LOC118278503 [Spodoptera frugiperda]